LAPRLFQGNKLVLVNKADATQTFFMIGNVGIRRGDPDRTGVNVVNTVFGGRFTSMLNEALRINSGLTYGAFSRFEGHQVAGPFAISSFTRNETTTNALDMALDVLRRLHREGLSESQLRSAKAYLKGQFPPRLETTDQLAALLADLEFFGLDDREINELFARVDSVTVGEARRLIRNHFPLENLVLVLIGKADEIKAAVAKYAPQLEVKDITHPGFN
jgi:DNA-directed RNA polymerase